MVQEVAFVTGGASGLGRSCVERFIKEGYETVFCDLDVETGEAFAIEVGSTFIKADISNSSDVEQCFEKIKNKFGRLDVIVANAGIPGAQGTKICDTSIDNYKKVMDINCDGTWYTLKYGAKLMAYFGNGGRIVTMSSSAGLCG